MASEMDRVRSWLRRTWDVAVPDDWLEACIEWVHGESETGRAVNAEDLCRMVFEQWLVCDLREIGAACLPPNLASLPKISLSNSYGLQVNSIVDVSCPMYEQLQKATGTVNSNVNVTALTQPSQSTQNSATDVKGKRVLVMKLTDGAQDIQGMEYRTIPTLKTDLTPGTKIVVHGNVLCRSGMLLLKAENVSVLGGEVDSLAGEIPVKVITDNLNSNVSLGKKPQNVNRTVYDPSRSNSSTRFSTQRSTQSQAQPPSRPSLPPSHTSNTSAFQTSNSRSNSSIRGQVNSHPSGRDEDGMDFDDDIPDEELLMVATDEDSWDISDHQGGTGSCDRAPGGSRVTGNIASSNFLDNRNNLNNLRTERANAFESNSRCENRIFNDDTGFSRGEEDRLLSNRGYGSSGRSHDNRTPSAGAGLKRQSFDESLPDITSNSASSSSHPPVNQANSRPEFSKKHKADDIDDLDFDDFDDDDFEMPPPSSYRVQPTQTTVRTAPVTSKPESFSRLSSILQGSRNRAADNDNLRAASSTVTTSNVIRSGGETAALTSSLANTSRSTTGRSELATVNEQVRGSSSVRTECDDVLVKKEVAQLEREDIGGTTRSLSSRPSSVNSASSADPCKRPFTYLSQALSCRRHGGPAQRISVKAYVSTLVGRLENNNGRMWTLQVKINDGTAALDVQLGDAMLTSLIGIPAAEFQKMKKVAKSDQSIRQQLEQGVKQCQAKIVQLSSILEVEIPSDSATLPCVTGYREVNRNDVEQLKTLVESARQR